MAQRQLPDDFREFIECLNKYEVRYLLVGGWAVGIYGNPRATKDIDFLIGTRDDNIERLQKALFEFGAPTVANEVFQEPGNVYRIGSSPIQIDIINQASGIDFDACYARRKVLTTDEVMISMIAKADLITNKKASGRLRDLADVEFLEGD
jgi:hypothetical protein